MNDQTITFDPDQVFPPRFIAASEKHRLDGYFHLCIFLISLRKESRFSQTSCIITSFFSKDFLFIQDSLLCAFKDATQYCLPLQHACVDPVLALLLVVQTPRQPYARSTLLPVRAKATVQMLDPGYVQCSSGVAAFGVILSGDGPWSRKFPVGSTWNTKEGDLKTERDYKDRKTR